MPFSKSSIERSSGRSPASSSLAAAQTTKPLLTLDEFFNAVEIRSVRISPDGHAVAIETVRADWEGNRFRNDLWLYRDDGARVAGATDAVGA
jgi:hypothetical protein